MWLPNHCKFHKSIYLDLQIQAPLHQPPQNHWICKILSSLYQFWCFSCIHFWIWIYMLSPMMLATKCYCLSTQFDDKVNKILVDPIIAINWLYIKFIFWSIRNTSEIKKLKVLSSPNHIKKPILKKLTNKTCHRKFQCSFKHLIKHITCNPQISPKQIKKYNIIQTKMYKDLWHIIKIKH